MDIKRFAAAVLAAALMIPAAACSKPAEEQKKQQFREFSGIFTARLRDINDDNEIQQIIAEKTGALIHQQWIIDPDDIDRTFSEMMISGEYPDFMSPNAENCQILVKQGAFIPIDNYWEDCPNLRNYFTEKEWDRVRADDGHIYYVPLFSCFHVKDTNPTHGGEAFWIQTRVLEWAGYPQLKTLDDYFDVLERYLEANPTDENGEPFYGYEIEANDSWFFALDNPPMFLDGYPNDGCCIVDPDTLQAKDYNLSPTARRWFQKLNDEYQKGVIDQECFLLNSEQYYEKLASGRVLGMVDQQWNFNSAVTQLPPECTYIPFGITIDEGIEEHYRDRNAFDGSSGLGVSVSCPDPQAAVKFLNDLLDPEIQNLRFWGIEGVDYYVREDGIFDQTEEQYTRWRDEDYRAAHMCMYDYIPYVQGMAPDGINAYNSSNQPNIFFAHLKPDVQRCFEAYGVQTYNEMLNEPPENAPWYPMWTYSNSIMDDTDYGKVMKQIDEAKRKYLPLLVMSSDFDATWQEYQDAYAQIDTQIYFDELTAEVHRRVDAADAD